MTRPTLDDFMRPVCYRGETVPAWWLQATLAIDALVLRAAPAPSPETQERRASDAGTTPTEARGAGS